ncbi:hypothetical protein HanRHA438_Chr02g0064871 [Helianthus annuus]|nr:hypothetical protein HanRHA438_Chr02g0064871 [Helianthus annuus]
MLSLSILWKRARLIKTEDMSLRRLDTEDFVNIQGGVCWCICLLTSSCNESCI